MSLKGHCLQGHLCALSARDRFRRQPELDFMGKNLAMIKGKGLHIWCIKGLLLAIAATACLAGCRKNPQDLERRYAEAKALFDRTTKETHLPSSTATGPERGRLELQAIAQYRQLLKQFPEQSYWCAEALCALGNVYASQTNTQAALECWSGVVSKHPNEEWEVLTALKSSADLLWDANRRSEAKPYYQKIVDMFDRTNAPQATRIIVKGSKLKLEKHQP
jgi:tetratricopeptide (TPR) repeat protein